MSPPLSQGRASTCHSTGGAEDVSDAARDEDEIALSPLYDSSNSFYQTLFSRCTQSASSANQQLLLHRKLKQEDHTLAANIPPHLFNAEDLLLSSPEDRPFPCLYCDARFKKKQHLQNHERIHTGEKYVCDICKQGFSRLHILKHHVLRKHLHPQNYMADGLARESVAIGSPPPSNAFNETSQANKQTNW